MTTYAPRRILAAAAVLVSAAAFTAAAPAGAAIQDGTSNTVMVSEVQLDQAHHRVMVRAAPGALTPGRRFASLEVSTPQLSYVLNNTMISGYVAASDHYALNFTEIRLSAAAGDPCTLGASACLIEYDGLLPPA
jgi:hypothetical protein